MKRSVHIQDPVGGRIVIEGRPGNTLVLRVDRPRVDSSSVELSFIEANCLAEFLQEVAGYKLGNQDEADECAGPDGRAAN